MSQLTPAKALEIAKNCEDGSVPPTVIAVLEKAIGELWQRIQYQPMTYVMSKEEFVVFNYYRSRFANVPMAQQAVARFWNNFQGDSTEVEKGESFESLFIRYRDGSSNSLVAIYTTTGFSSSDYQEVFTEREDRTNFQRQTRTPS
ncbi:MAG: hypothetical protein L6R37_001451 [Teloschistes peruensis]|nr:MAG: hypothetical protein L6R37_001451 [Teloschistes peruensis]